MVVGKKDSASDVIKDGAEKAKNTSDNVGETTVELGKEAFEEVDQVVQDVPVVDPTDTKITRENQRLSYSRIEY